MRSTTVMPNVRLPYVALAITSYSISPQSATGARTGKTHITYMVNEQTHTTTCAWNFRVLWIYTTTINRDGAWNYFDLFKRICPNEWKKLGNFAVCLYIRFFKMVRIHFYLNIQYKGQCPKCIRNFCSQKNYFYLHWLVITYVNLYTSVISGSVNHASDILRRLLSITSSITGTRFVLQYKSTFCLIN